jgi:uncharacterized membrane protein
MQLILIIVGAFVGMWLGDGSDEMLGFGLGALLLVVGYFAPAPPRTAVSDPEPAA